LRCQLRLSKQFSLASGISARLRVPRGARKIHDEAASEPFKERDKVHRIRTSESDQNSGYQRLTVRPAVNRLSKLPLGKLYGFKGHQLRQQQQALDVDTLGKRSEIILLKDSGLRYDAPPEMDEVSAKKVDILARVKAERGLPSLKEINNNINSFRPETPIISAKYFKAVEQELNEGFTMWQLRKYIQGYLPSCDSMSQPLDLSQNLSFKTSGWLPGVSASPDVFYDDPLRGFISEAYTPKQRLVLLLLRQCWGLEVTEISESIGEVELSVDRLKLELLISKYG